MHVPVWNIASLRLCWKAKRKRNEPERVRRRIGMIFPFRHQDVPVRIDLDFPITALRPVSF
jgi:hypothetical protein